ncbi:MAG: hypothetical protein VYC17_01385 [Nitrospinota bacterium]|nr:hypothetical protein [Nitrospinota bacterium]
MNFFINKSSQFLLTNISIFFLTRKAPAQASSHPTANTKDPLLEELLELTNGELYIAIASKKKEKLKNAPGVITVVTTKETGWNGMLRVWRNHVLFWEMQIN